MCFLSSVVFSVDTRCVFSQPYLYSPMFNGQITTYTSFADGANHYTLNLASTAWVLYSPTSDMVSSGGTYLGPATNNLAEYHVVIGLLTEALANDVRKIRV